MWSEGLFLYNDVRQIVLVFGLYTFEVSKIGTKMWIVLSIISVWLMIKAAVKHLMNIVHTFKLVAAGYNWQ